MTVSERPRSHRTERPTAAASPLRTSPALERSPRAWGFWTQVKLDALERYLKRFTTASAKASTVLYLDLFAGSVDNVRRDDPSRHFTGSTVRALEADPPFTHLRFFEMDSRARQLEADLSSGFPEDQRYRVVRGDCNKKVADALSDLRSEGLDWSPTFCFVDPDGLDVTWSTLAQIASFKNTRAKTKAELLVLLSHTTIPRLAGWDSAQGLDEALASSVTDFFGTPAWRRIHERRTSGISAAEARHLYTSLFRHRLQETLGYKKTLTIEMGNERGAPVYVLVFATDHPAGDRIMSSVLEEARAQSAEYRAEVTQNRNRQERERAGVPNLFDVMGEDPAAPPQYFETIQGDEVPMLPSWLLEPDH